MRFVQHKDNPKLMQTPTQHMKQRLMWTWIESLEIIIIMFKNTITYQTHTLHKHIQIFIPRVISVLQLLVVHIYHRDLHAFDTWKTTIINLSFLTLNHANIKHGKFRIYLQHTWKHNFQTHSNELLKSNDEQKIDVSPDHQEVQNEIRNHEPAVRFDRQQEAEVTT